MHPFSSASILALFSVVAPAAQSYAQSTPAVPSAPATHSHTPAPSSHGGGTVTLDQFVTTATPIARNQVDLAQSTTVLGGHSLYLKQQSTIGETLASETGISATAFGPGASRPIIRGLGGDRIRLLENSVGTLDASVTSPDHAVSVEPLLIDRIEIVRGPASLLYGSNAVGGVINVITHRIETDLPTERMRGSAEVRFGSAADEFARGAVVDLALLTAPDRALILHLDGFRRSTEDLRIPGFAESARLRAEESEHAREHAEPLPTFAFGRLPNSQRFSESAAAGLSYVSRTLHAGASYSGLDTRYGVPGHIHEGEAAGTRIDLRQRRTDVQGEWHQPHPAFITGARFKLGHAQYRHAEVEPDGTIGTLFKNNGHEARFELLHGSGKPWSGAVGVQSSRSKFNASGEEAFLPPNRTRSNALFAFQEFAHDHLTWQFGGRVERNAIAPEQGRDRRDDEFAGSVGAVWKFHEDYAFAVSTTQTGRSPNAQELFANGPHAGTQAFEIGDEALKAERSLGLEASLRRHRGAVTGAFTVFANSFRGYIYERPTGQLAIESNDAWEFLPSGEIDADDALPVYRYAQRNARLWGAELEALWHLHDNRDYQLDVRFAADFTRGREGARHLPRIPAPRVTAGLAWSHDAWNAGAEFQRVLDQNRTAPDESSSDAYNIVNAHLSRMFTFHHARWDVFLRGSNLTNAEIRPHTSFVKDLAPAARRAVSAGVRVSF